MASPPRPSHRDRHPRLSHGKCPPDRALPQYRPPSSPLPRGDPLRPGNPPSRHRFLPELRNRLPHQAHALRKLHPARLLQSPQGTQITPVPAQHKNDGAKPNSAAAGLLSSTPAASARSPARRHLCPTIYGTAGPLAARPAPACRAVSAVELPIHAYPPEAARRAVSARPSLPSQARLSTVSEPRPRGSGPRSRATTPGGRR
jgi:hypothetical protein